MILQGALYSASFYHIYSHQTGIFTIWLRYVMHYVLQLWGYIFPGVFSIAMDNHQFLLSPDQLKIIVITFWILFTAYPIICGADKNLLNYSNSLLYKLSGLPNSNSML